MQASRNVRERFSIAIPASIVSDTPHLREKTGKLGVVARACSIFGVNEINIYHDDPEQKRQSDADFSAELLRYLDTPQYLRKKLFKLNPELRFAGILPPLQTPPHDVPRERSEVTVGDLREGVVVSRNRLGLGVDAGLKELISASGDCRIGERVTLRLIKVDADLRAETVDSPKKSEAGESEHPIYWGYRVNIVKSLGRLLSESSWDLKVGTSRYGTLIQQVLPSLSRDLKHAASTVVAFGSPKIGLEEILAVEKISPKDAFQYLLNTVPNQQTRTVRTEEALLASLSIINLAYTLSL